MAQYYFDWCIIGVTRTKPKLGNSFDHLPSLTTILIRIHMANSVISLSVATNRRKLMCAKRIRMLFVMI